MKRDWTADAVQRAAGTKKFSIFARPQSMTKFRSFPCTHLVYNLCLRVSRCLLHTRKYPNTRSLYQLELRLVMKSPLGPVCLWSFSVFDSIDLFRRRKKLILNLMNKRYNSRRYNYNENYNSNNGRDHHNQRHIS